MLVSQPTQEFLQLAEGQVLENTRFAYRILCHKNVPVKSKQGVNKDVSGVQKKGVPSLNIDLRKAISRPVFGTRVQISMPDNLGIYQAHEPCPAYIMSLTPSIKAHASSTL
jgi:hypothetical protein